MQRRGLFTGRILLHWWHPYSPTVIAKKSFPRSCREREMRVPILLVISPVLLLVSLAFYHPILLESTAEAAPTGPLMKHLFSLLKWTMPSSKTPQTEGNGVQFEKGYLVETVLERGNKLGVEPYSLRVSPEGELFAVDSVNSNIVRITPPLSQYSRARLVAGSFQGHSGYVDGKPTDAHFRHPRGVTMDDKGNIYVADTSNMAIRKIGEAGVTTLAGGKSNVAGYMDGPSEDAKFSSDFDVVYVGRSCSLLVVDRGNAALREILLHQEDCRHQDSANSSTDIIMVIVAVLVGYISCVLQHGFGTSSSASKRASKSEFQETHTIEKPTLPVQTQEDPIVQWPSLGRLITDLLKLVFETVMDIFLHFIPLSLRSRKFNEDHTPKEDTLIMPEDKSELPFVQRQGGPSPFSETSHAMNTTNGNMQHNLQKSKPAAIDDLSFSRSSPKQQESADSHGSNNSTQTFQFGYNSQKNGTWHRRRDGSGELVFVARGAEPKPIEIKAVNYDDPEFDRYNTRSNIGKNDLFHF